MTSSPWTPDTVHAEFERWRRDHPDRAAVLDAEATAYVQYHLTRYARLLTLVDELLESAGANAAPPLRVLDVGANIQTELLRSSHPDTLVDTLGFEHPAVPPRAGERHVELDLNELASNHLHEPAIVGPPLPELADTYDVVILAEVIEHLHVPAATPLRHIASWLRPGGHVVVQTPNGAALHKRLRLLLGRNPVEPPREEHGNPGHFHEYTLAELRQQLTRAGLQIERLETANYFGGRTAANRLYGQLAPVMPPTWRHGITLCARRGMRRCG